MKMKLLYEFHLLAIRRNKRNSSKKDTMDFKKQDEYRKAKPEIKKLSYLLLSTLAYLGNIYIIKLRIFILLLIVIVIFLLLITMKK